MIRPGQIAFEWMRRRWRRRLGDLWPARRQQRRIAPASLPCNRQAALAASVRYGGARRPIDGSNRRHFGHPFSHSLKIDLTACSATTSIRFSLK
jgi:hypothetical protein